MALVSETDVAKSVVVDVVVVCRLAIGAAVFGQWKDSPLLIRPEPKASDRRAEETCNFILMYCGVRILCYSKIVEKAFQ
jgi:hypothetical protein